MSQSTAAPRSLPWRRRYGLIFLTTKTIRTAFYIPPASTYAHMGPRLSQGTSGATRHIRKIRCILRLRNIHCNPHIDGKRSDVLIAHSEASYQVHSRQAQSSSAVDSIMPAECERWKIGKSRRNREIIRRCMYVLYVTYGTFNGTSPQEAGPGWVVWRRELLLRMRAVGADPGLHGMCLGHRICQ